MHLFEQEKHEQGQVSITINNSKLHGTTEKKTFFNGMMMMMTMKICFDSTKNCQTSGLNSSHRDKQARTDSMLSMPARYIIRDWTSTYPIVYGRITVSTIL
jgi:hypothetical protein